MRNLARAVLALVVLLALGYAVRGRAAVSYVSDSGSDDSSGATIPRAWRTVARANQHAYAPGDTLRILASASTYDAVPNPLGGSAAQPLWVIGDSAAPNKVRVPGGEVFHSNIVFDGLRFTSKFTQRNWTQIPGLHIRNCVLVRGASLNTGPGVVAQNRIGTDSSSATFQIDPLWFEGDFWTVIDNQMRLRSPDATDTDFLLRFQADNDNTDYAQLDHWLVARNQARLVRLLNQPVDIKLTMFNRLNQAFFHDNKWTFVDSSNVPNDSTIQSCQSFLWRDHLTLNRVLRDTVLLSTAFPGKGDLGVILNGSGHLLAGGGNSWDWCVFKNLTPSVQTQYQWNIQKNDSMNNCVVVDSTGLDDAGFAVYGTSGAATIAHNTFMNLGKGGAFRIVPGGDWSGPLKLRANIFYTRSTASSSRDYAALYNFRCNVANPIDSDWNLFSHYGGQNQQLAYWTCTGQQVLSPIGATTGICSDKQEECNSVYGSPQFADSSAANFDATLGAASAARGIGEFGDDAGARPYTADVTAPGAVADLYVSAKSGTTVSLSWTATGDDAAVGTAFSYDIRYSLTAINSGNFASKLVAPGSQTAGSPALPSVSGTGQGFTVTGLAPLTSYYFALKAVDEAGNVGAISNVVSVTTTSGGNATEE